MLRISFDQCKAVAPVSLYLFFFLLVVLRLPDGSAAPPYLTIAAGLVVLTAGLVLFLEGLQWGLMPLGHTIGRNLPLQLRASLVLAICFLLGVGVTIAEPAISALQAIGSLVAVERAAYLYAVLNEYTLFLILAVAVGVGFAASLGVLRFYRGWQMKPIILITLVPTILLSIVLHFNDELRPLIGLAWDCGAITTGPVTVPIVLAVGIGVASAKSVFAGKPATTIEEGQADKHTEDGDAEDDGDMGGFGIVTLASLMPVITVQVLGILLYALVDKADIEKYALKHDAIDGVQSWYDKTPQREVILSVRALVPLLVFLVLILKLVLKQRFPHVSLLDILFDHSHSHSGPSAAATPDFDGDGDLAKAKETKAKTKTKTKTKQKRKRGPSFTGFKYHRADTAGSDDDGDEVGDGLEMVEFDVHVSHEDLGTRPGDDDHDGDGDDYDGAEADDAVEAKEKRATKRADAEKEGAEAEATDRKEVGGMPGGAEGPAAEVHTNWIYVYLVLALLGLMLFNIGLTQGLTLLGSETGYLIPLTFMSLPKEHNHHHAQANATAAASAADASADSGDDDDDLMQPLYPYALGLSIALAFSFVLGFGATFAEPALRVLGKQAERLSQGRMKSNVLIYSVCVGVGAGITLGIVKITFHIPLLYLILPAYAFTVVLTLLSPEEFVNVAWDCGGVTTGPVTVPLVLALGLAFGNAVDANEGFGILTMASVGPIAAVLTVGLLLTTFAEPLQRVKAGVMRRCCPRRVEML